MEQAQEIPRKSVYSVTDITLIIKGMMERSFPSVAIEGEISNMRPAASGHLYFTLKDSASQISAVMFRSRASALNFAPKDGMMALCSGALTVYQQRGNYQIVVSKMEMAGEGNILQMLEKRKRALAAEGLFDSERKRAIPKYPRAIGVVTSATGAALRDIMRIARQRNRAVDLIVLPALVQGSSAADTIARQIRAANCFSLCDTLIVGRGGGSLEDLLPFSEEIVVRAIAASKIPVISAVGHEIDWALSDYAADARAPTPSAAAELAVPILGDTVAALQNYAAGFESEARRKVEKMKLLVKNFSPENLELQFRNIEQPLLARFDNAKVALLQNISEKLKDAKRAVQSHIQTLEDSSPQSILARGYSVARLKESGAVLRDPSAVKPGDALEITLAKGALDARAL